LTLNVSESDNAQDLDLAREVSGHFRLKKEAVEEIIAQVVRSVRPWAEIARKRGISQSEIDRMAPAFRLAE
jgi:serine/threonine-protein kinase HipA